MQGTNFEAAVNNGRTFRGVLETIVGLADEIGEGAADRLLGRTMAPAFYCPACENHGVWDRFRDRIWEERQEVAIELNRLFNCDEADHPVEMARKMLAVLDR